MTEAAAQPAGPPHSEAEEQRLRALAALLRVGAQAEQLLSEVSALAADARDPAPGPGALAPSHHADLQALAQRADSLLQRRRDALAHLQAQELEAAQRRQRLLQITTVATHSLDLQSFIDPGYIYRYVNDRYLEYWACRRDQIEGHSMAQLIGEELFTGRVKPMIDRAFAGERVTWETAVDYPGRGRRHVRATFLPAHDEQGAVNGVVMRVEDVDELMAAQHELQRTVELLERRTEEQQRFIHMVSHDLREPINSICNFSALLEEDHAAALDPHARRYLGFVAQGGQRMRTLLDGLLDYVRLEGAPLQRQDVAVDRLLEAVRADLSAALQRSGGELQCTPLPVVRADPTLLRLVLQNLVSNAIKFHAVGVPPQVSVFDCSDGQHWRIAVRDQGIGIGPEQQDRLFGLFRRLRPRREYDGSGLGLAIARRITELHGGRIDVQSTAGAGSTFTLYLPRQPEPA